jgi:hypothetical protein
MEVGRLRLVLVEGPAKKTEGWWTGRTDQNKRVIWPGNDLDWDWTRMQPLIRFSKERQVSLDQSSTSALSVAPWKAWIENQVRQSRANSTIVSPGEYAVVQVTEAKGIALRGKVLWKCTLQEFHESEIGNVSLQDTGNLLQSWLSTPLHAVC